MGKNNVVMEENQIDAVLAVSGGDMRRAVTSLQSVQALLAGQKRVMQMLLTKLLLMNWQVFHLIMLLIHCINHYYRIGLIRCDPLFKMLLLMGIRYKLYCKNF